MRDHADVILGTPNIANDTAEIERVKAQYCHGADFLPTDLARAQRYCRRFFPRMHGRIMEQVIWRGAMRLSIF